MKMEIRIVKDEIKVLDTFWIEGILQKVDKINSCGRIYPKKIMEKAIALYGL